MLDAINQRDNIIRLSRLQTRQLLRDLHVLPGTQFSVKPDDTRYQQSRGHTLHPPGILGHCLLRRILRTLALFHNTQRRIPLERLRVTVELALPQSQPIGICLCATAPLPDPR